MVIYKVITNGRLGTKKSPIKRKNWKMPRLQIEGDCESSKNEKEMREVKDEVIRDQNRGR